MQTHATSHTRRKLIATVTAIIVVAGGVVIADNLKAKQTTTATSTPAATQTTTASETAGTSTTAAPTTGQTYKDGTYTANSRYFVPHSNQSIEATVTLKNGVVTDVSVKNSEGDNVSADYQEAFTAKFKPLVVGQKIDGLQIDMVAGASDTTEGFNEALAKIAQQAKA